MASAMGFAVGALAALGEAERAKECGSRSAILLDPEQREPALQLRVLADHRLARLLQAALDLLASQIRKQWGSKS